MKKNNLFPLIMAITLIASFLLFQGCTSSNDGKQSYPQGNDQVKKIDNLVDSVDVNKYGDNNLSGLTE